MKVQLTAETSTIALPYSALLFIKVQLKAKPPPIAPPMLALVLDALTLLFIKVQFTAVPPLIAPLEYLP